MLAKAKDNTRMWPFAKGSKHSLMIGPDLDEQKSTRTTCHNIDKHSAPAEPLFTRFIGRLKDGSFSPAYVDFRRRGSILLERPLPPLAHPGPVPSRLFSDP